MRMGCKHSVDSMQTPATAPCRRGRSTPGPRDTRPGVRAVLLAVAAAVATLAATVGAPPALGSAGSGEGAARSRAATAAAGRGSAGPADGAPVRLRLMLDWFPNPDHVPIYYARESGLFRRHGLEVEILVPADPSDPLKLAAAGRVDLAISYQPSVSEARAEDLPVTSVGVLVEHPLNTIMTLADKGIRSPADLAGRRVGYSVPGFEDALLGAVLERVGVSPASVQKINVHFNLTPALLAGQVDAVVGAYKNYESVVLEREGARPVWFELTDYGVPDYYELVVVTSDSTLAARRAAIASFVRALDEAIRMTRADPRSAFDAFMRANPELDRDLNEEAFRRTLPEFATGQVQSEAKWANFHRFLVERGVVAKPVPANRLFTNLVTEGSTDGGR